MFKCKQSYCVPAYMVCDSVKDCPYGEDEDNCSYPVSCPGLLKCKGEDICVHPDDVGDKILNCPLSEDDEAPYQGTGCPANCTCHGSFVRCTNQNMKMLPQMQFMVKALKFTGNIFDCGKVKGSTFTNLSTLIMLDLSHNQMSHLSLSCLGALHGLQILDLSLLFLLYNTEHIKRLEKG